MNAIRGTATSIKMNNENPDDESGTAGEGVGSFSFQAGDGVGCKDISSGGLSSSSLRHLLAVAVAVAEAALAASEEAPVVGGIMRFGAGK